ncbi:4Fe-4S dicluster domain-containing protein [Christensenella timonensis]|uniref:4Fe-4S dicluster domain-containing protein n=1 Tax=Christensenella timonensis TaxID=1816678 RepID=UPI000A851E43|nr:4Fe-4S dicluster domain-containing protein [Christensenella timonensis]
MMKKLPMSRIGELFSAIDEKKELYLPVFKAGKTNYERWTKDAKVKLNVLNTVKSPKDMFFPQSEDLVAFKMQDKNIEVLPPEEPDTPFVVFGVRPCDNKSLDILDMVFLAEPVDTYYKARRENGVVVGLACSEPEETCFCGAFGIDATQANGDVATWITGDTLYWKPLTQKGEELTAQVESLFEDAEDSEIDGAVAKAKEILDQLPLKDLSLKGFDGDATGRLFDSPKWEELYRACIGCGTCTFVCPTCQCYDIRDFDTGHGIKRYRCWDSCMYSDFTRMAHGNPRKTQLERFRQRFMHKLVYFPANNGGEYSCVGCGRCVSKCPISMNIVKVIKALGETEDGK